MLYEAFVVVSTDGQDRRVKSITIADATPSYWIPALLSAAHSNNSIRVIDVDNSFAALREDNRLQWVLYAVFRRSTSMNRLKLNCEDLAMEDVTHIYDFLAAENYLGRLMGSGQEQEDAARTPGLLTTSRFQLTHIASHTHEQYISSQPLTVAEWTSSSNAGTMLQVLLPGYGRAQVRREDVLEEETPEPSSSAELASVNTICLRSVSRVSSEAVLRLIPVLSRRMKTLEVAFCDEVEAELITDWVRQFVTMKTQITGLGVNGHGMSSLDAILDGFLTDSLHLTKLEIDDRFSDSITILSLFEALGNQRHPIARQLRELRLAFSGEEVDDAVFGEAVKRMLARNQYLARLCLRLHTNGDLGYIFDPIRECNEDVVVKIPLEIKNKLAFLSVIAAESSSGRPARSLNTSVVGVIFEFCATAHKREVDFSFVRIAPSWY